MAIKYIIDNADNSLATQSISGTLSVNNLSITGITSSTGLSKYVVIDENGNAFYQSVTSGTSLSVADYETGVTFSNVENIIFRGGTVNVPGGTATGVLAAGSTPTVVVWIPAPPQAVYASHFNTTDGNTVGTVTRSLSVSTVRISTPTSEGTPFETGSSPNTPWAGTNQQATISSTPTISTSGLVTGFSGTSSGDSRIIVDVFRGNGSTFSTYTTPTLYQNGVHTDGNGITVTIGSYAADDSGFPEIYTTKYKATVSVSVNMATIFALYGLDGGRYSIRVKHITDTLTDGGVTYTATTSDVFYDTNPNTPSIDGSTTIIESTNPSNILTKHISGVEYYITGSQFEITSTGINNLNKNTQGFGGGTTKNFTITGTNYNLPTYNIQAWSPSVGSFLGWSNNYDNTGLTFSYNSWAISSSTTFRYRGAGAVATSQDFDPWGSSSISSTTGASVLIDQVSDNSTRLGESFNGETERLVRGTSTFSAWNSTSTLGTGISNQTGSSGPFCDACVVGGYLVRPDKYFLSSGLSTLQPNLTSYKPDKNGVNPDYSGSGYQTTATYHRKFYTTSLLNIASFIMTFRGSWPTGYPDATSSLLNSQMKVYIRRIASNAGGNYGPTAPPLSLHGALYDSGSYNDGNSGVDTAGALIRTSTSGNAVSGTFGTDPANVGFWMELQILNSDIKLDYINVTLVFSDNSTDSAPVT